MTDKKTEDITEEEKEREVIACLIDLINQDIVEQTGGLYNIKDIMS